MRFLLALVFALNSLSLTEAATFRRSIIQSGSGTFVGVIVNMKGKRIRGASVTVTGTSFTREVKPNRDGYFELDLPVGTYKITVKKSGFATYSLTELEIKSNGGYSHVFRLEPSHPWVHEQRIVEEPIKDP
jgi:hypothetical protein